MSMNTPTGQIVQTTAIKQFKELQAFNIDQYLLAINNITQGDGARISLQNLISSTISTDVGNLLGIGQDGKLSINGGAFGSDNGWLVAPTLSIDWEQSTVSGNGGKFYLNGILYPTLSDFTVSNIPSTTGMNFLYYDFTSNEFEWSVGYPEQLPENMTVILTIAVFEDGTKFGISAWNYGGIQPSVIDYLDASIGMANISGGDISNVIVNNSGQRFPFFDESVIGTASFNQKISPLTSKSCTQVYKNSTSAVFSFDKDEIVPINSSTTAPQYIGEAGVLQDLEENTYMNVWAIIIPSINGSPSDTQYIFVTGDTQYPTIDDAKSANPNQDKTITFLKNYFYRFLIDARFTITYDGINFSIADYSKINLLSGGSGSSGGIIHSDLTKYITNCILEAPNEVATYSGNTITVKQGLKVLFSNGRNADNTLNNIEYSVPQEYSKSVSVTDRTAIVLIDGSEGSLHVPMQQNVSQGKKADMPLPSQITNAQSFYYATDENKWYIKDTDGDTWEETQTIAIATCVISDGTITSLTPYQPVELLKRSDKEEIVSWAMPSNEYIDLELKSSGTSYLAPFDCIVTVTKVPTASNQYISLSALKEGETTLSSSTIAYQVNSWNAPASGGMALSLVVPKNRYFAVGYNVAGKTEYFRMVKLKGAL